jgi:hypothetical protein
MLCRELCKICILYKTANCYPDVSFFQEVIICLDTSVVNPHTLHSTAPHCNPRIVHIKHNHLLLGPRVGQRQETKSGDSFPRVSVVVPGKLNYILSHALRPLRHLLGLPSVMTQRKVLHIIVPLIPSTS